MHINVKDVDKFPVIKKETCCALCESLNIKVLPTMGHWEKLSNLYISWCLGYLSFLFRFIWGNLHVFGMPAQIPASFRTRFLFKLCLKNSLCRKRVVQRKKPLIFQLLVIFLSNLSNISNTERYQLSGFVLLDLSWYLGIWLSSWSNQDDN